MDYALGMSYDQLKENKNAIDAYSKAFEMEPDNLDAERGLAQALLNDNQLSAALKHFEAISVADPQDAQTYLRIAEIERRQGHYEQALTTLKKAKALASDSLEIGFNEALIDDSLGHYDEAVQSLQGPGKADHPPRRPILPRRRRTIDPSSLTGWPMCTASRTRQIWRCRPTN